jgi:hypothetical protein
VEERTRRLDEGAMLFDEGQGISTRAHVQVRRCAMQTMRAAMRPMQPMQAAMAGLAEETAT